MRRIPINPFVASMFLFILFSFVIINYLGTTHAQQRPRAVVTCSGTDKETDCLDKDVCLTWDSCMVCLKRLGYNQIEAKQQCDAVWGDTTSISTSAPSLTHWGTLILVALIIVTGAYLWIRRKPVVT